MKLNNILDGVKTVGITGHVRPDGDCLGSTLGLYNYIKDNYSYINVDIFLEKNSGGFEYLKSIDEIKNEPNDSKYDVFIVLDCSSKDRILPFEMCFDNAKKTVCIDHHVSNCEFADINVIDSNASSASEVLYGLLEDDKISKETAECIYTGIIHDTGVFKYSCTSKYTMQIAGSMMEKGIDYSEIIDSSFYKKTYVQNKLLGQALDDCKLFCDGKLIVSYILKESMDNYGVDGGSLGGIVEQLRLTDGVEVAMFVYQKDNNEYKVSLRSKRYANVAAISMKHDGGGHVRAAGFTMYGELNEIMNQIISEIEEIL